MSTRQELQERKLEAETEKIRLDSALLSKELDERNRPPLRHWWQNELTWWSNLVGVMSVAVAVVGGVMGLWYGVVNFMAQQHERNSFNVTKEVIRLVEKLDTGDANASILLAAYGEHAVPVLLNHVAYTRLKSTTDKQRAEELNRALQIIMRSDKEAVIKPLRSRIKNAFKELKENNPAAVQPLTNYIYYLSRLDDGGETIDLLCGYQNELVCNSLVDSAHQTTVDVKLRRPICLTLKKMDLQCR